MKRLKISAILLAFVMLITGCSTAVDQNEETTATEALETTETILLLPSRDFFEKLDRDSTLEEIIEQAGEYRLEGDGIVYFVWDLNDGSEAKIVFNSEGIIEFIYIVTDDYSERVYDRDNS